jgi:hypothetical protein
MGYDTGHSNKCSKMLQRDLLPPSSVTKQNHQETGSSSWYSLGLPFDPEDGSNKFIRDTGNMLPDYTVSHPSRQYSSALRSQESFAPTTA